MIGLKPSVYCCGSFSRTLSESGEEWKVKVRASLSGLMPKSIWKDEFYESLIFVPRFPEGNGTHGELECEIGNKLNLQQIPADRLFRAL